MWKKNATVFVILCVATSLLAGGYVWSYRKKVEEYSRAGHRTIKVGELERSYELFVPKSLPASDSVPLLLVLHGGGGTGKGMQYLTLGGFNTLADRDGFLVVYPDGLKKNWNDGRMVPSSEAHRMKLDDVGFLKAMIAALKQEFRIDPQRVYSTGISNGAFMSARLAIEAADVFAAIAPVTGSLPTVEGVRPGPSEPISVLMINSTEDTLVPMGGGAVGFKRTPRGTCIPVVEAVQFWAQANGCATGSTVLDEPDRDPVDGTRVKKHSFEGGLDGTEVVLLEIIGGGHTWPSGAQYAPEFLVGKTSKELDACRLIWDFFKAHPKQLVR